MFWHPCVYSSKVPDVATWYIFQLLVSSFFPRRRATIISFAFHMIHMNSNAKFPLTKKFEFE